MTRYHDLNAGDICLGSISGRQPKPSLLVDLVTRGVICLPSALAQILNRSKASQAQILKAWMHPDTMVVSRRAEFMPLLQHYQRNKLEPLVTKEDRLHCGQGVRKWDNIEILYSFTGFSKSAYPFVVQPFLADIQDIRVLIVGDYVEAYQRFNPYNFRMNLAMGGESRPIQLERDKEEFCRSVMERGGFPYAHLDLLLTADGNCYLSEIALTGGIKGARIDRRRLDHKKREVLENLAQQLEHAAVRN